MPTKAQSHTTTDHEEIQRWAESRGAEPACVKGTGKSGDVGILRLDFPGYSGEESLQHISWDEWFNKFDEEGLALLLQEETAEGEESNFNKLVSRETADASRGRASIAKANGSGAKKTAQKAASKKTSPKRSSSKQTKARS
jgi:hypothetical protein